MTMMNEQETGQNLSSMPPALTQGDTEPGTEFQKEQNPSPEMTPEQKRTLIGAVVAVLLIIIAIVGGVIALAVSPPQVTAQIRDIFIILMSIMSLMIGLALIVLMVQLARLTNLLQNELRPIIDSMNETISHLRGTSVFLGENLAEPVIKVNEYFAGLSQLLNATGLRRKSKRSKSKTTKGE
jgi:hypothetical protein